MLPLIAVGTLIAAAASEPDWKEELRSSLNTPGGVSIALWNDLRWRLYRTREYEYVAFRIGTHSKEVTFYPPPRKDESWAILPKFQQGEISTEIITDELAMAFPSIWTLMRFGLPREEWEHHAFIYAVRGILGSDFTWRLVDEIAEHPESQDWEGHGTWQNWWKAHLIKPDFVHPGLMSSPLQRATGRFPLLLRTRNEMLTALNVDFF